MGVNAIITTNNKTFGVRAIFLNTLSKVHSHTTKVVRTHAAL